MRHSRSIVFSFVSLFAAVLVLGTSATLSFAQATPPSAEPAAASIRYPIKELGSCKDKATCKAYCDKPGNMQACVAFAEQHGILKGEDLRVSKIMAERLATKQTPGGCTDEKTCDAYCNGSVEHLNECISFGEELGMIPQADLKEAKQIAQVLAQGAKMPGACKTKNDCEKYCAVGSHIDECLNFAETAGLLDREEVAQARKVAPFLKNGETPGKCTSKDQCESYCKEDTHFTECLSFAEKAGFVSAEDAAMAKKTGGKGPGNCRGKDECEEFCNNESHAAQCLSFAQEHGLLTEEQKVLVDTGMDKMKAGLEQIPAEARGEVMTCLDTAVGGRDKLNRLMDKQDMPTKAMGDKIQECFSHVNEIMQRVMSSKAREGAGAPNGESRGRPQSESKPQQMPENPSAEMCAAFASAPSCDYVPEGQPRELCKKCKGD